VLLPGEELPLKIIQEGKEHNQGVGYLDDGTMVVVENGRRYLESRGDGAGDQGLADECRRLIFASPVG
jgi:uncharacterized protein YacL